MFLYYVRDSAMPLYVEIDVWSGEMLLREDIENATASVTEGIAFAVACDARKRWPNKTFIVIRTVKE